MTDLFGYRYPGFGGVERGFTFYLDPEGRCYAVACGNGKLSGEKEIPTEVIHVTPLGESIKQHPFMRAGDPYEPRKQSP